MWPGVLFFVGALAGFADQIGTWIGTLVSGPTVYIYICIYIYITRNCGPRIRAALNL